MMTRWLSKASLLLFLMVFLSCAVAVEPNLDELDQDGDGILDKIDKFPLDGKEWADLDGDGIGDNSDADKDGDGCANGEDTWPEDITECLDSDKDGIGNNVDSDDDGDGILDNVDTQPLLYNYTDDIDGDGIRDGSDPDKDGDSCLNADDTWPNDRTECRDTDSDGIGNNADTDDDGDGVADTTDTEPLKYNYTDSDGDGLENPDDTDDDGDGCLDVDDDHPLNRNLCFDNDNDGVENTGDAFPNDATESVDADNDNVGANTDCNDSNANISTNHHELCDNATDDDCDNSTNEIGCVLQITGETYNMGPDNDNDEGSLDPADGSVSPVHDVTITTFYLDKHEVTNSLYRQCVSAGSCTAPNSLQYSNTSFNSYPVTGVSWTQASAYCTYAKKRLPTESEWELAATNGDSENTWPWGNAAISTTLANYFTAFPANLAIVTDYSGGDSDAGVLNLIGNAAEWVSDFSGDYNDTTDATVTNPTGPEENATTNKVYRGGSFQSAVGTVDATDRWEATSSTQSDAIGFRCADSNATSN